MDGREWLKKQQEDVAKQLGSLEALLRAPSQQLQDFVSGQGKQVQELASRVEGTVAAVRGWLESQAKSVQGLIDENMAQAAVVDALARQLGKLEKARGKLEKQFQAQLLLVRSQQEAIAKQLGKLEKIVGRQAAEEASAAAKPAARKPTTRKSGARKPAARKPAAKRAAPKRAPAKRSPAKKTTASRSKRTSPPAS